MNHSVERHHGWMVAVVLCGVIGVAWVGDLTLRLVAIPYFSLGLVVLGYQWGVARSRRPEA